ncbi:hypothetical protein P5G51_012850 [Virgibacillus sp. 179-BFC.A HS]|uniref:Uncharacterized protein n=1 Tax=Tigheibacillus jepli TaxID=3035914 RepID=A0ABU5CIJ0_9BACI|nr:hypothetical protein [Virgibacillus sp. 179-BFC.A HS]MDY0406159.1 hypothetical protein [Virgibacillus sp. 179-BFC.A HS]
MAEESKSLQKRLEDLEKHLQKQEEIFQSHEKHMNELEGNMGKWHTEFIKQSGDIGKFMEDLEKKFEG